MPPFYPLKILATSQKKSVNETSSQSMKKRRCQLHEKVLARLPCDLCVYLLEWYIAHFDVERDVDMFTLVGYFKKDITRTKWMLFRSLSIRRRCADRVYSMKSYRMPYLMNVRSIIYLDVHVFAWPRIATMISAVSPKSSIRLSCLSITGPHATVRSYTEKLVRRTDISVALNLPKLKELRLSKLGILEKLCTNVHTLYLDDVSIYDTLEAKKCKNLCITDRVFVKRATFPCVVSFESYGYLEVLPSILQVPTFFEDNPNILLIQREGVYFRPIFTVPFDRSLVTSVTLRIPSYWTVTMENNVDLKAYTRLRTLNIKIVIHGNVLLPRHVVATVTVERIACNSTGEHIGGGLSPCQFCGAPPVLERTLSHIHGTAHEMSIINEKFEGYYGEITCDRSAATRLNVFRGNFLIDVDVFDIREIHFHACRGSCHVQCDKLRLHDSPDLHYEGYAKSVEKSP